MAYKIMGITSSPFYTNMMIYYIMCDTPTDLPSTISDIGYGTVIGYGSRADIISDSSKYLWNGSQWVRQTTGGGGGASSADQVSYDNTDSGLTATNVQDAIDEIHDTDETQDRTLAELQGEDANQQLEIDYAINTGAKNLFPITAISQTIGGVTFTVNSDGTITANGTKTNNDWFYLSTGNSLAAGTYVLSSGLAPQSDSRIRLIITTGNSLGSAIMGTEGERQVHKKQLTSDYTGLYYAIRIENGTTVNNLTFKPMIRRAEITDDTFQPYAPTNRDLYEAKTEQKETNVIANFGAKNLLEYNGYGTGAENGVTYNINADGTITINGTPQGTAPSYIELKLNGYAANVARFCDGNHILSGCPEGGSDSTYRMYAARGTYSRFDYGNGVLLTATTLTDIRLVIYIANGYTANNLVFKPMIRSAEITDDTFQPYAPTNRKLYETGQQQAIRYEDSAIIRLNQLSWSQTSSGTGMWIADCYTAQSIDTIVSVIIISFSALKPSEVTTLFTYVPSSVSGMHTVRLICDRNLTGISSNPTLYLRVFGYGYQTTSTRMQSLNSPLKLNLSRNDLNESLDTNFDLTDSIPEVEETEETE